MPVVTIVGDREEGGTEAAARASSSSDSRTSTHTLPKDMLPGSDVEHHLERHLEHQQQHHYGDFSHLEHHQQQQHGDLDPDLDCLQPQPPVVLARGQPVAEAAEAAVAADGDDDEEEGRVQFYSRHYHNAPSLNWQVGWLLSACCFIS